MSLNEEGNDNMVVEKRELHQCPNDGCENSCFGKQCSECHIKMINERSNNFKDCCDCEKSFYAIRKDGSFRMRCRSCQEEYNNKHISICNFCGNSYHAKLANGKVYNKCYYCYQKSINTSCETCGDKSFGQKFCKPCYESTKQYHTYEKKKCDNTGCSNITTYPLCTSCKFGY